MTPRNDETPDALGVELAGLRHRIDASDRSLLDTIAARVELAKRIGEIKLQLGQPVLDPAREAGVVRRAAERAREKGLDPEAVREIYWRIVGLARRTQRDERGGPR